MIPLKFLFLELFDLTFDSVDPNVPNRLRHFDTMPLEDAQQRASSGQ
jgi:hypothetical protein